MLPQPHQPLTAGTTELHGPAFAVTDTGAALGLLLAFGVTSIPHTDLLASDLHDWCQQCTKSPLLLPLAEPNLCPRHWNNHNLLPGCSWTPALSLPSFPCV